MRRGELDQTQRRSAEATPTDASARHYWLFVIALTIAILIIYQPVWNGASFGTTLPM